MKKIVALLLMITLVITLGGCGGSQSAELDGDTDEIYTLKLANQSSETHPSHFACLEFKEKVEEFSEGKIKVEIFFGGTLGNDRDLTEGLQLGTVDMAIVTTSPLANFVPEYGVLDLPFVFEDWDHGFKFRKSEAAKILGAKLEEKGMINLGYLATGFRHVTSNSGPVEKVDDLKGFKIRVMQSDVYIDTFKALGAAPTPMAWGEVYTALQQGVIDGQENPIQTTHSQKVFEVQKYLSLTGHTYTYMALLGSKNNLSKLPEDLQELIATVAEEATYNAMKGIQENEQELLKDLEEKGMIVNELDRAPFKELVTPVYDKFTKVHGDQILKEIQGLAS